MTPITISLISAATALIASILGPFVTLAVARRQFRANVLSTNRQKWIDTFRDRLAQLIALVISASTLKSRWQSEFQKAAPDLDRDLSTAAMVEKIVLAYAQVSLLVKDDDAAHVKLLQIAESTLDHLRSEETTEQDIQNDVVELTKMGRAIIRYEWGRVKRGS